MIIRFLRPFFLPIAVVVALTFVQVIADLSLPNYLAMIVDRGIAQNDTAYILRTGGTMLLVALAGVSCAVFAGYLASRAALGVGRDMRTAVFGKVTGFSLTGMDSFGTASLITRTTNDVQQIQTTVFMMLRMLLRAPLMCVGGIVLAVRKDWELSLVLFAALPLVVAVLFVVLRRAMPLFRLMQRRLDRLNLVLRENLVGIRIVRAFSRIGYEKRRFSEANNELTSTSLRINRLMAILDPMITVAMNGLTIAIVWTASFRIDRGDLMIGDMLAFIQYAMMIFMAFMMLTMLFVLLPRAFASGERIRDVLDADNGIKDTADPVEDIKAAGRVVFDNVTFRFEGAEMPAVCGVSFTASPGETVAIIGGTGSGKSSVVNLIPRFFDVESGSVTIDGVDVRTMRQHDLRGMIGYVPQKVMLFAGTVAENVRYGKHDATPDEVRHACAIAQAAEFIEQLPEGYESNVAQGGANFSGGQKQRLSIARAIVRRPAIYIFDDSFSALDFRTDSALQSALKAEVGGATVIMVAQRVTSIMNATRIIVMDNGRAVGIGTHSELMAGCGVYREIVRSQLSETEIV